MNLSLSLNLSDILAFLFWSDRLSQDVAAKRLPATVGFACSSLQHPKKQAEQLCFVVSNRHGSRVHQDMAADDWKAGAWT